MNVSLLHLKVCIESFQIMTWLLMSSLPSKVLEKWDTFLCGWFATSIFQMETELEQCHLNTFCTGWDWASALNLTKNWNYSAYHFICSFQFHFGGDWIKCMRVFFSFRMFEWQNLLVIHRFQVYGLGHVYEWVCGVSRLLCALFPPNFLLRMSPANTIRFHPNLSVWCQTCSSCVRHKIQISCLFTKCELCLTLCFNPLCLWRSICFPSNYQSPNVCLYSVRVCVFSCLLYVYVCVRMRCALLWNVNKTKREQQQQRHWYKWSKKLRIALTHTHTPHDAAFTNVLHAVHIMLCDPPLTEKCLYSFGNFGFSFGMKKQHQHIIHCRKKFRVASNNAQLC